MYLKRNKMSIKRMLKLDELKLANIILSVICISGNLKIDNINFISIVVVD